MLIATLAQFNPRYGLSLIAGVRRHMGRGLMALVVGLLLQAAVSVCAAEEIRLEGGSILKVTEIEFNRFLPRAFYDQAMSSLQNNYPVHKCSGGCRRPAGAIYRP